MSRTTPERSLEQRRHALKSANAIRVRRARFKADLKAGRVDGVILCSLILEPPQWLETMKIADLLMALPKYGATKVHKTLRWVRVSPSKTMSGLSSRQRDDLVSYLK